MRARMDALSARLGSNFPGNLNDEGWKQLRSTLQSMTQDMLAIRFKLKVRRSAEQASAYALVLDGETSKLQAGSESELNTVNFGCCFVGPGKMDELVHFLSEVLGQPVVDRTGLPGLYNINLHFESEVDREERAARSNTPDTGGRGGGPSNEYPGLPTALREQLGLKLETTKAPVPFLVIESVEQPSEN